MILLLDAGNTRLKWGVTARGQLEPGAPFGYDGAGLEANLEAALGGVGDPLRILLCSVADAATSRRMIRWLRNRWPAPLATVVPGRRGCGVRNAYPEPELLGADRWAALVGARMAYPGQAVCVVDAGTAVTVDGLDADGTHLGGLIVPGLTLARTSLDRRTGRIGSSEGGQDDARLELANSTREAVRNGAHYQLVALLDRVIQDLQSRAGREVAGVLTGGDAGRLLPLLGQTCAHRPHLVLEGLAEMARRGCNQQAVVA